MFIYREFYFAEGYKVEITEHFKIMRSSLQLEYGRNPELGVARLQVRIIRDSRLNRDIPTESFQNASNRLSRDFFSTKNNNNITKMGSKNGGKKNIQQIVFCYKYFSRWVKKFILFYIVRRSLHDIRYFQKLAVSPTLAFLRMMCF